MATFLDIRDDLAAAIEAITPAVRPAVPYLERNYTGAPEEQSDSGTYELRSFQIEPGPVGKPGGYQGPLPEVVRTVTVVLFYPADDPVYNWRELIGMAGDDLDHIAATLRKYTRNRTAISVVLGDARSIELKPTKTKGIWAQRLILPILYRRGAVVLLDNYEAGDVPNFASTEAMETADANDELAGEKLGSVDGVIYQIQDGVAVQLGEGDTVAVTPVHKAAASLPQTAQGALFTVSGKCFVLKVIGEVTTEIQAQANNLKLVSNPTVGADVDLCAVVDANADTVGTVYTISGTASDAMVATPSGAVKGQVSGVDVFAGTIDLSASASSTGATKWTIQYVPVDDGATITAT